MRGKQSLMKPMKGSVCVTLSSVETPNQTKQIASRFVCYFAAANPAKGTGTTAPVSIC